MISMKIYVKFLIVGVVSILLFGCGSTQVDRSFVQFAEMRLKMGEPVIAYSFIEDVLKSGSEQSIKDAERLYLSSNELRLGAIDSFSEDRISSSNLDIQSERLKIFQRLASPADFAIASKRVNEVFVDRPAADLERRKSDLQQALINNTSNKKDAFFVCHSKLDCDKAFSLVQIFILSNADMKIQTVTDTIVETYNPSSNSDIGISAIKMPGVGQSAAISITVKCHQSAVDDYSKLFCLRKSTSIYKKFPAFMAEKFTN